MEFSYKDVKQGLGEVQSTFRWNFQCIKEPSAVKVPLSKDLRVRMESVNAPTPNVEDIQIELFKHKLNFTGDVDGSGEIQLTIVEGTDAKALEWIIAVLNARSSSDGSSDKKKTSKYTAELQGEYELELLDPQDKVTATVKLVGAMIKPDTSGEFGQSVEGRKMTITISYEEHFWSTASGKKW